MMFKNISILGSTGSIGTQALDVVDHLGDIKVWGLSTNTRIDLLEQQIRKYRPAVAAVMSEEHAHILKTRIQDTVTKVVSGLEGLIEAAVIPQAEMVLTSVVGIVGLIPTLQAIQEGKHIALANKETLVAAGRIVMEEARKHNISIIPVDSEHSAIFQCLQGNKEHSAIKNLILTASGGPFLSKNKDELKHVTPERALKHPKWNMGNKISIDSATLMNKGLEIIEAMWLFNVSVDRIKVVIHPQSIIHSMVEFVDNSIIAQMGVPDMKLPIQYAFTYPHRKASQTDSLNFLKENTLTFAEPDYETFSCLKLAYKAAEEGGTMPVVLNAANEIAVQLFLENKIGFTDISEIIEETMKEHKNIKVPLLQDIVNADGWAREFVLSKNLKC